MNKWMGGKAKFVGASYLKYLYYVYGLAKFFKWKEMSNRCKTAHAILLQNRDVRNQNLLLNFKSFKKQLLFIRKKNQSLQTVCKVYALII